MLYKSLNRHALQDQDYTTDKAQNSSAKENISPIDFAYNRIKSTFKAHIYGKNDCFSAYSCVFSTIFMAII